MRKPRRGKRPGTPGVPNPPMERRWRRVDQLLEATIQEMADIYGAYFLRQPLGGAAGGWHRYWSDLHTCRDTGDFVRVARMIHSIRAICHDHINAARTGRIRIWEGERDDGQDSRGRYRPTFCEFYDEEDE